MTRIKTYVVERARGCDVRLDESFVSRSHAEGLRLPGERMYVTDCVTTNGTSLLDGGEWREVLEKEPPLRRRRRRTRR